MFPHQGNVLVILADDLGTDKVGFMGEHAEPPPTPRLDALAVSGTIFDNAYAAPSCSPARANIMTGRYGLRTGIGEVIHDGDVYELPLAEITIPEMLEHAPLSKYLTTFVGKWHLSSSSSATHIRHPRLQGWQWMSGTLNNLVNYESYTKLRNGAEETHEVYATTDSIDDALLFIDAMSHKNWVLHLSLHAPHTPYHWPPDPLHNQDTGQVDNFTQMDAMIEAMDTEIGRLVDTMDPAELAETTIIFLGDNGTTPGAVRAPLDGAKAKLTLFEGGTGVPMFVVSPFVGTPGTRAGALVHAVDVFTTIADIAGVDVGRITHEGAPVAIDGQSLLPYVADPDLPGRTYLYTEQFSPLGPPPYDTQGSAVRNDRYKLIVKDAVATLYDLEGRFDDGPDLLADPYGLTPDQQAAYDELYAELERMRGELVFDH